MLDDADGGVFALRHGEAERYRKGRKELRGITRNVIISAVCVHACVCISRLAKHVSNPVSLEARNNQVIELSEILATIVWSPGLPFMQACPSVSPLPHSIRRFVSVPIPYLSAVAHDSLSIL